MLVSLVAIVAFIWICEVILKEMFAEILNFIYRWFLLSNSNFRLIEVSLVIRSLRATGYQNRLTARFCCFKTQLGIWCCCRSLCIPLLKDYCMLLNQWRPYERSRCLLNRCLFAKKPLRVRVISNGLRRIDLVHPELLLDGCSCGGATAIERSELRINLCVFTLLGSRGSIEILSGLDINVVGDLVCNVTTDGPLCKRLLFEWVCVESCWQEVLFRGFLSKQLPTVHILTLCINCVGRHHLTNCFMWLHKLVSSWLEFGMRGFLS